MEDLNGRLLENLTIAVLGNMGTGRARHSVRAVMANQTAFVDQRRRAEDCPPYR